MGPNLPSKDAPRWLLPVTGLWLWFITVSPFLVTVTHFNKVSLLREIGLIAIVVTAIWCRQKNRLGFVKDDIERLIAWLLVIAVLSTVFVTHDLRAFAWSARYSLEPLAIFWALHTWQWQSGSITKLVRLWVGWATLVVIIGLLFVTVVPKETLIKWGYSATVAVGNGQWVGGATLPAFQAVSGSIPRLQSTLTGPIQFAGFALLLVFLLPTIPETIRKQWLIPGMLIAAIGVIGSFSRAAWVALLVISLYKGAKRLTLSGWKKGEIGALAIIIIVSVGGFLGSYLTRPNAEPARQTVAHIFTRDGSDQEHVNSISGSWGSVKSVWLTGFGFGRSGAASIQYAATNSAAPKARFVDNSYLRWVEEVGVFGLIVYLGILYLLITELNRQGKTTGRALAAAGTALAICALFTDMWLEAVPVLTFFALAGLIHQSEIYAKIPENIKIPGLNSLSRRSLNDTVDLITSWAIQVSPRHIVTYNPEMALTMRQLPVSLAINQADLVTADGAGIVAAAAVSSWRLPKWRWLRPLVLAVYWLWAFVLLVVAPRHLQPETERVTGSDLVTAILHDANQNGRRLALLGSTDKVLEQARANLTKSWPGIKLVFAETGVDQMPDNGQLPESTARTLISRLEHANPNYLLVAFGVPRQELFIHHYKRQLGVPVMIGVSGAFDSVLAKTVWRAPKVIQSLHLEWLWRLILQPSRLNRIITAVYRFPIQISRSILDI